MSDLDAELEDFDAAEFDPGELQDGLLKGIDNVHEWLAMAREKHPIMAGSPFTEETHTENTPGTGFTVLSYALVSEALSAVAYDLRLRAVSASTRQVLKAL